MPHSSTSTDKIEYQTKLAPVVPWDQGAPVINGPEIYGASPGKPFIYSIPTVGERPLSFSADNLPPGLSLDRESGVITGQAETEGEFMVSITAKNQHGQYSRKLKLVIRPNALALTPPLGWNSWNCYRSDINDAKIRHIAAGMVSSGLAAWGYNYVNLDSGWQSAKRGGKFNSIIPHEGFPDMTALCDYIHSLGLKAGIYSGPYITPCGTEGCGTTSGICDTNFAFERYVKGRYIGVDKYEFEDVSQWADWGFDYFKYDWEPADIILTERMSRALRQSKRDFVYTVVTRAMIKDALRYKDAANTFRSNMDTSPTWESVVDNGFKTLVWNPATLHWDSSYNEEWNPAVGPGHWFDLDMTAILPRKGQCLSRNELIFCISCWMMRPSPIFIDCNPMEMDDFTKRLLCNEEVIAVNQDPLGSPAANVHRLELLPGGEDWIIQFKTLADNSFAMAFFNLSDKPAVAPKFSMPVGGGKFNARDLWQKQDIGEFGADDFTVGVDAHCAKVYKISPLLDI